MWNHEHEMDLPRGSVAARLFLGEPLRGATVASIRQTAEGVVLSLECGWECREFGHEPGPSGKSSQVLAVTFAGVAVRTEARSLGTLIDVRTKDTPLRRRTRAAWHFRMQLSDGVIDVVAGGVTAQRDDGRPFAERLLDPYPHSTASAASPGEVPNLVGAAASGDWTDRADALTRLGLSGDPRGIVPARAALAAAEPAVLVAAIAAVGRLGTAADLERLVAIVPPRGAPEAMFRAHVGDAVDRILERAASRNLG